MKQHTTDSKTVKFEWNDALVREFVITYNNTDKLISGVDPIGQIIEEWKQLKLKETEESKRIEVAAFFKTQEFSDGSVDCIVHISKKIPEEKYEAVKKAIEGVLNDDMFNRSLIDSRIGQLAEMKEMWKEARLAYASSIKEPVSWKWETFEGYCKEKQKENFAQPIPDIPTLSRQGKGMSINEISDMYNNGRFETITDLKPKNTIQDKGDWEIVSYRHKILTNSLDKNVVIDKTSHHFEYAHGTSDFEIFSVRRLSDNTVFYVGDEVDVTTDGGKGFRDTIHHFTFTSGVNIIDVYFKDQLRTAFDIHWLKLAKKLPPKEEVKSLLFTTSDGVGMYMMDGYYSVSDEFYLCYSNAHPSVLNEILSKRTFSTKEKAEEYILMNKPCMSIEDLMNHEGFNIGEKSLQLLKQLAKNKINHTKEQASPKQMWHKVVGVHDEQVLCVSHGCVEYNPLNKEHSLK